MWKSIYIYYCVTLLAFFSCRQDSLSILPALEKAEMLMEGHPDSSLAILQNVNFSEKLSDRQYATWGLLLTEAKDKTFGIHASDSLISVAANYFEKQKDIERKAKAWYYMGRVNQDLLHYEEAVRYYQKAITYADKSMLNKQLMLIYNQLSNIYRTQRLYSEALNSAKKAVQYCELANDTLNLPYIIRNVGRVYLSLNQIDSSVIYYDKALSVARLFNSKSEAAIVREIGLNYKEQKKYDKAVLFIKESMTINPEKISAATYLNLGSSLFYLNQFDSAAYYLRQSQYSPDIFTKAGSYHLLYKLAVAQKDYKVAIEYNDQYQILSDSIGAHNQKDEIRMVIHKYEQQELKKKLEVKVLRDRIFYGGCIFLLVIVLLIGWVFYLKQRWGQEQILHLQEKKLNEEKRLRRQSEEQIILNKQEIKENVCQIEKNKQQIKQDEEALHVKDEKIVSIYNDLLSYKNNLLKKENEIIELYRKMQLSYYEMFIKSGLPERIKFTYANAQFKEKQYIPFKMSDMPQLKKELNICFDDFVVRLQSTHPMLKETEINICCLLKAGARTINISEIIAMTPNAVTKKKGKISDKMGLPENKGMNSLEAFLIHF